MKNFLPSKKFTYLIIFLLALGLLFILAFNIFSNKKQYSTTFSGQLGTSKVTINGLLEKDSDNDGVPDWEEALWGTNPNKKATFDNLPDIEYIKKKKSDLKIEDTTSLAQNGGTLTETDKFAQEFFASLLAMKQSGQIDQNTITNVSSSLGQKMVDPSLLDKYSSTDIKLGESDGIEAQKNYYLSTKKLFDSYKKNGIGDELEIMSTMASSGTNEPSSDSAKKLALIADAYQNFAENLLKVSVPGSLSQYHLQIINNANNTGIAVRNMLKISDDPVVGLGGLSQYQKYSNDLVSSVGDLETILFNNGIII